MQLSLFVSLLPLALAGPAVTKRAEPAPLLVSRSENRIENNYIVKLRKGSSLEVLDSIVSQLGVKPQHEYRGIFRGFASQLDTKAVNMLRLHPEVDYIEQDHTVVAEGYVTQEGSTWGLGRISHRKQGIDEYTYDASGHGAGVCAYVIDSGIELDHPEFEGRAEMINYWTGDNHLDTCGHGTHVAGTIGSKTYGVAKKVQLLGMKVLKKNETSGHCSGSSANIIAAINSVVDDAKSRDCPNGVVVNMSLGGDPMQAKNDATAALVAEGVFVAVAAGNNNLNASTHSPGNTPEACTVGGTAEDDTRYKNSNWGPLVDILAPAVKVLSTYLDGTTKSLTGTSMATPHIAGLAAYLASKDDIVAGPEMCDRLREAATQNAITNNRADTVNLLAFNANPDGEDED